MTLSNGRNVSTNRDVPISTGKDLWIRRFHPATTSGPRLVCFPHAGGSASFYHPLSARLHPNVEVLAVQYPGRQDRRRERPVDTIAGLAQGVFAALAGHDEQPMAFFGHSMGAVVAFEVGRLMQARTGVAPVHLFASGRRAPSTHRPGAVHRYSDEALVAELIHVGGTDPALLRDQELLATILPMVRSDYRAVETYRYASGAPLACPITVLVGDRDPQTTGEEAAAWRAHGAGEFDLRVFPGGHFFFDVHWGNVAGVVSSALSLPVGAGSGSGGAR